MKISLLTAFVIISYITLGQNSKPYFQQTVNNKIQVKLDDSLNTLTGFIETEYVNQSPDELNFIWIHLYPNAYKNNKTALAKQDKNSQGAKLYFLTEQERGYLDSLHFTIDGISAKYEYHPEHIDISKLILNKPLKSGEKITYRTPFYVKIPKGGISRMGHVSQQYQISQWFPKPAVYDKFGWHEMPYLDQGEFYSEFGKYEVSITLPKEYLVAATGNLQTQSEMDWLNKKAKVFDDQGYDTEDGNLNEKNDSNIYKTIVYTQDNIHDFAWFADKLYYVHKSSVELPFSKRKVTAWTFFRYSRGNYWAQSTDYVNDALIYYSQWNGEYPYDNCTAVDGALGAGGGMEYPTITVIGRVDSKESLDEVITHEVGHNWFYGILGFNERRYPYMDEGINTSNEIRYMQLKYPNRTLSDALSTGLGNFLQINDYSSIYYYYLTYLYSARYNKDQSAMDHSDDFSSLNYGAIVYYKTGLVFNLLRNSLGDAKYDSLMHEFFDKWKFKHPDPEDLYVIIKKYLPETKWLTTDFLNSTKKNDYKILKFESNKVLVRNERRISAPVNLTGLYKDSIVNQQWYDGFRGEKWLEFPTQNLTAIRLDHNNVTLDANRKNNTIRTTGILKKTEHIKLKFLGGVENEYRRNLYWTPVVAWNDYNKFMSGVLLHNGIFPSKLIEWQLMPMWSFGSSNYNNVDKMDFLTAKSCLTFRIPINVAFLQTVVAKIKYQRFGENVVTMGNEEKLDFYQRFHAEMDFLIHKKSESSRFNQDILISRTEIYQNNEIDVYNAYSLIAYKGEMNRSINPFHVMVFAEQGDLFQGFFNDRQMYNKTWLDAQYHHTYGKKGHKGLTVRLFAGTSLDNNDAPFYLNANGQSDYRHDYLFLSRNTSSLVHPSNFSSHMYATGEGGFVTLSNLGMGSQWLATLNVKASIPKTIFKWFANIGTYQNAGTNFFPVFSDELTTVKSEKLIWETGIEISILPDLMWISLPILKSNDLNEFVDKTTKNYIQQIYFSINLNKLYPWSLLKSGAF